MLSTNPDQNFFDNSFSVSSPNLPFTVQLSDETASSFVNEAMNKSSNSALGAASDFDSWLLSSSSLGSSPESLSTSPSPASSPASSPSPLASASASASSSASSASSASASYPAQPVTSVPRSGSTKYSRERLDLQIRCDNRRRQIQKSMYVHLRDTLKESNVIRKRAREFINTDDESTAFDRNAHMDKLKKKSIENYTRRELTLAAVDAIRSLNAMKGKLEAQIIQTDLDCLPASSSSSSSAFSTTAASDSSTVKRSAETDINELLAAIHAVNQKYLTEMYAVKNFESYFLPRYVSDMSNYFNEYAVIGLDSTIIHGRQHVAAHRRRGSIAGMEAVYGQHSAGWKSAFLSQMQALVAIRTMGKFKYRPSKNRSTSLSFGPGYVSIGVCEDNPALHTMDLTEIGPTELKQMLRDTTFAPKFNTGIYQQHQQNRSQHVTIQQIIENSEHTASAPSFSSSSSSSSSSSLSTTDDSSLIYQHPLGPFSVAEDSYMAYLEVLENWVEMGKERYEKEIDELLPIAQKYAPECFAENVRVRKEITDICSTLRDACFHPLLRTSYEVLVQWYLLYSGKQQCVDVTVPFRSPGSTGTAYMIITAFLVRHPVTSLPMAYIGVTRKLEYN